MHSFGMTQSHVVLAEFPLVANPLELAMGKQSFIESFHWKPGRGTRFTLVDRATGAPRAQIEAEPFFAFHHVNAFETDGEVVVDLCAYPDPGIIDALFLDRLRAGTAGAAAPAAAVPPAPGGRGRPRRAARRGAVRAAAALVRPCQRRPYRYTYGASGCSRRRAPGWTSSSRRTSRPDGPRSGGSRASTLVSRSSWPRPTPRARTPASCSRSCSTATAAPRSCSSWTPRRSRSWPAPRPPHAVPFGFHGQYFG